MSPFLKLALETGPLAVFFLANARAPEVTIGGATYPPIVVATGAFMVATAISLVVSYTVARKIPVLPLVSGVFVFVFGALTVWLNDDLFIKLKPTIVNSLFCAILLGGLAFGKPLLKPLLEAAAPLTDDGWRKLTLRWALFFATLAGLNEVVRLNFDTDVWVNFKVFGVMPLTILFALSQLPLMNRHMLDDAVADKTRAP